MGVEGYPRGLALTKRVETLGGTETRGATWCWRRRLKEDAERCLSSAGRLLACLLAWLKRLQHWASPIERWEQQHSQNLVRENLFYACLWFGQWSDIFVIILNINSRYLFRRNHSILCAWRYSGVLFLLIFLCCAIISFILFTLRDFFWIRSEANFQNVNVTRALTGERDNICVVRMTSLYSYLGFVLMWKLLILYYVHDERLFISIWYSSWAFDSVLCSFCFRL